MLYFLAAPLFFLFSLKDAEWCFLLQRALSGCLLSLLYGSLAGLVAASNGTNVVEELGAGVIGLQCTW